MPITNNSRVLNYLPYAIGAYGTGAGTPGLQVGTAVPVNVPKFEATPNSGFQGALYKDGATGKYVIAFAGTNDLTDAVSADRRLASANLLEHYGTGSWDPQMTDALKFGYEAFRQIQTDHYAATGKEISLDQLRSMVNVTGHSLGGALAELTAKFFGIGGANIDGPGVGAAILQPEFAALKSEVREVFPEVKTDYALDKSQFGSYAYTVVGVAGTHVQGIEVQNHPRALVAEASMGTATASFASLNATGVLVSVGVAGGTAAWHPSGSILKEVETALGLASTGSVPKNPFDTLDLGGQRNIAVAGSSTTSAMQLSADARLVQDNVKNGLSPAGYPLDGSTRTVGEYTVTARYDAATGRYVETYCTDTADATERHLAASAVRILNDATLNRQERERLILAIQRRLIEHRQKASQPRPSRGPGTKPVRVGADPKSVQSRKRERGEDGGIELPKTTTDAIEGGAPTRRTPTVSTLALKRLS